jgi:rifampicin phosphotransferase
MEARLTRFVRQHLAGVLPDEHGGAQVLLRGLPGTQPVAVAHAVQSVDWYHPVAGELPPPPPAPTDDRHARLAEQRARAEHLCRTELAAHTRQLAAFEQLLHVCQRYAIIREEQARDFTLAWPVLRTCVHRLGKFLTATGALPLPDEIYFCTGIEVRDRLGGAAEPIDPASGCRTATRWQQQRTLAAPLTLGAGTGDAFEPAVGLEPTTARLASGYCGGLPAYAVTWSFVAPRRSGHRSRRRQRRAACRR